MNNVLDQDPPFVDGAFQDGYDPRQANIRGRVWYVALKKRFLKSNRLANRTVNCPVPK